CAKAGADKARRRADAIITWKRMMTSPAGSSARGLCRPRTRPTYYLKSTVVLSVLLSAIFESLARSSRSQRLFGGGANGFNWVRGFGMAAVTTPLANLPFTTPDSGSPPHPRKNQTYGVVPISFGVSVIAN